MFRSKLEVDRHVENCSKNLSNDTEYKQRCMSFAKLYFNIGEYEQARRYVSIYLSLKPASPEAHQLLGSALEKLGKADAALEAYRTSLDLDPKQSKLILKVCELLTKSDNVNFDQSGARYFCEKGQNIDPRNPILFTLKERLVSSESRDPNEVSKLLLKELETRPADVDIRVRLLRHLLQNNQIKEAYKHAHDIEQRNLAIFANSLNWYETLAEVLVRYQRDNLLNKNLNWEFWILLISVLDKLVTLSLDERSVSTKVITEYVATVFNFDQTLRVASENISDCPDKHFTQEFLNHYRGQLCLHLSTLVFKQAKKELIKYREASQITLPLLFAAYHLQPADLQGMWINCTSESNKQLVQRWHREASFRCSQAGHLLLSVSKDRKSSILEKAEQGSAGLWREQLLKRIFVTRDQQAKIKSSYFAACPQLVDLTIRLPDLSEVLKYDAVAQLVYPDSLHHYAWIGLTQKLPQFTCSVFSGLHYSVKNLNNCSAESLNVLDIQAFLYCAISCAQLQIEEAKRNIYYPSDRPSLLPAAVTGQLGTLNQSKWLISAYKMYVNDYGCDFGEVRLTLIRGIETVRCVGNHGLDVKLLVTLAKTFAERSKLLTKQSEIEFNDARAELYWRAALPLLEKLKNNQAISYSTNRLFEYKSKEMSPSEILAHIDDGKLFSATQLMKKKEYERALELFEGLRDPYASFYQAQIYKLKAEEQTSQNRENVTSEMRSQNIILLSRARDCLYLTLDRLRDPSVDRKHPLNIQLGTEIEKIERMLSRIDPDVCLNRNECDGMSDENVSSVGSMGDHFNYGYGHSFLNGGLTPRNENHLNTTPLTRREARPSPERLDAQLRQLAASKDTAIQHITEQNKFMIESHRALLDEIRGFKDAVNHLASSVDDLKGIKSTVEDLKSIKKSVDELKNAVDDLQNITDVVGEMKKELAELKKDTVKIKNNQLSDEDLYVLDEEYGSDYNAALNSNVAGLASSLYPNLGRIPATNSLPYGPPTLYPGMYHPMLHYPGLGLPQAGALAFGPEAQLAEFRAMTSLSQGLTQAGAYAQAGLPQGALPQTGLPQTVLPPNPNLSQSSLGQFGHSGLSPAQPILPSQGFPSLSSAPSLSTVTTSSVIVQSSTIFPTSTQTFLHTTAPASKAAAPVNVVITSSDPLPTTRTITAQPILSVTIPPQHLKGNQHKKQPHNYQIQLPTTTTPTISTPSVMNQVPLPVSTQSLLSNVAPPVYSAIADKNSSKNTSLGFVIEKSLSQSFNTSKADLNKSNVSSSSVDEHDPCPDFKPIIPLPDEVPVNTGEENETALFAERAKLFRYANKEWRERGVGVLKILKNPKTGKVRLLMRRDQVHKICANHFLTKDMTLTPMNKNDKAYVWAANDFADQEVVLEKLCVRFKTANEAQKFYKAFEDAKKDLPDSNSSVEIAPGQEQLKNAGIETPSKTEAPVASLGGFVFTSTPTFKPKDGGATVTKPSVTFEAPKLSPFASFTFSKPPTTIPSTVAFAPVRTDFKPVQKINENLLAKPLLKLDVPASPKVVESETEDSLAEEYEPPVDFKPVVPLPELVEVRTGEENAEVLFENKAKLLRYDSASKEWKERGIGQMKLLKYEHTIRFVMRREQVHKICCNHQLLKNVDFSVMPNNPKAICWFAQDFSEGVLAPEMFAIRFKTAEQAKAFRDAVISAQAMLDENSMIAGKASQLHKSNSKGEKNGDGKNTEKKVKGNTEPKKTESSPGKQTGWGDKFKPKSGSWECKVCYIVNDGKINYCVACDTPKHDNVPKKESETQFSFGVTNSNTPFTPGTQKKSDFSFPSQAEVKPNLVIQIKSDSILSPQMETKPVATWGDAFKPKEGSWECKECYTRNDGSKLYCASCENPKDGTVPKKDNNKGINLDTPGLQFSFGIPSATPKTPTNTPVTTTSFTFGTPVTKSATTFSFGVTKAAEPASDSPLNLAGNKSFTFNLNNDKKDDTHKDKEQFVFGSPQKHTFEFTPRSPRRQSGGPGDEESEGSYVEEEEDNIYFKPVIPLPDKIEVKTGEEQEAVLYCRRAKLFRFVEGEWKERGIGDVKILRQPDTGKLRVLMRREQVLKICLNHSLTNDVKYTAKDEKTWLFCVADYSEGEIQHSQFCIRFKDAQVAREFKNAVDDALRESGGKSEATSTKSDDSDIELVFETTVTPDEEEEARKLGLPPKFMSYRQLKDCSCDECKKDDVLLKELFTPATCVSDKSVTKTAKADSTSESQDSSIFGTPMSGSEVKESISLLSPVSPDELREKKPETLKELLSRPSLIGQSNIFTKTPAQFSSPGLVNAAIAKTNLFGTDSDAKTPTKTDSFVKFTFKLADSSQTTPNVSGSLFGTPTEKQTTSIFGGQSSIFGNPSTKPGDYVFGTPTTSASIFGGPADTKLVGSLFGSGTPTGGNVFGIGDDVGSAFSTTKIGGGDSIAAATATDSIFGKPATSAFGASTGSSLVNKRSTAESVTTSTSTEFGSPNLTVGTNSMTTKTSMFRTPTSMTGSTTGSIFGSGSLSSFGQSVMPTTSVTGSIFGNSSVSSFGHSATPVFGSNIFQVRDETETKGEQVAPVFGSIAQSARSFESFTEPDVLQAQSDDPLEVRESYDDIVLKCDGNLSFASLAKGSDDVMNIAKFSEEGDANPFAHLGAGAPVFGTARKGKTSLKKKDAKEKDKTESGDEGEGETGGDGEYDPHYEPIVPLPNAIVVSTGEEEEQRVFNERAKLFRYDAGLKEWKERGVGQLKILFHPVNHTYRFLLRREQVHKVVLNQLITPDLDLQPMTTSDKAWLWVGHNYSEDSHALEKLAARFKNTDLANKFHEAVQKTLAAVKDYQSSKLIPSTIESLGVEDVSGDDERESVAEEDVEEEEEKDYEHQDDDDYDDEDDRTIMYKEKCTLGEKLTEEWTEVCEGEAVIDYDPDIFGARITVIDEHGLIKSSTVIGRNTIMTVEDTQCTWRAVEWADNFHQWRDLQATFSSEKAANEFHITYLEGVNYAEQSDIVDDIPLYEQTD